MCNNTGWQIHEALHSHSKQMETTGSKLFLILFSPILFFAFVLKNYEAQLLDMMT